MNKETKDVNVRIPISLYKKLNKKCDERFKTISEVVRELIAKYINEEEN